MQPERLWQSYVWSPGICVLCRTPAWVAPCGESRSAASDTSVTIEACAACLIDIERIHDARVRWQDRGVRPTTPAELVAYYRPAARTEEDAERLRAWLTSLLIQLNAATTADLLCGVQGRVVLPEAS